jgi:hypothetical protein
MEDGAAGGDPREKPARRDKDGVRIIDSLVPRQYHR